jgi:hypothetical protein
MTRARLTRLAVAGLATYVICAALVVATARDGYDILGIPLGFDFLAFHGAARLAIAGDLAHAFDPAVFAATLNQEIAGAGNGYYWLYPPTFALMIAPLGLLPYGAAFWLWTALGLAAYAGATWLFARDRLAVLAALAFPAVWVVGYHGQNAFFVAALFIAAVYGLLKGRDQLAGVAIGLLAIKPHLAILFPLALAASGRWRAFLVAAATAVSFGAVSSYAFGPDYVRGFFDEGMPLAKTLLSEERHWATIASAFVAAKLAGAFDATAWALQITVAIGAAALVALRFTRTGVTNETLALLVAASLLVSPYVMDYDLVVLATAGLLLFSPNAGCVVSRGYEPLAALLIAFIPIAVVGLGRLGVQIGWLAPVLTIALVELRLRHKVAQRSPAPVL